MIKSQIKVILTVIETTSYNKCGAGPTFLTGTKNEFHGNSIIVINTPSNLKIRFDIGGMKFRLFSISY